MKNGFIGTKLGKKHERENDSTNDDFNYYGWLIGPENSPYENGKFFFNIKYPNDYPFTPFKFTYITKIYNLGIDLNGSLHCCNYPELIKYEGWSPAFTLLKILNILRGRLAEYIEVCGFNSLYMKNKQEYMKKAREWTKKYAIIEKKNIWDYYEKKNLIGSGTFGDIYMALNKENKNQVAIKIIKIGNDIKMSNLIENEIAKLKGITVNLNFVKETLMDNNYIYLVMDLFDDNLENVLHQRNPNLPYDQIENIIKDINIIFNKLQK